MSESSEAKKSPESAQVIDARGLACPQPVVLVKKALDALSGTDVLSNILFTVLVDNETALENVVRFATHAGLEAKAEKSAAGVTTITISSIQKATSGVVSDSVANKAATAAPIQPVSADVLVPACTEAQTSDPFTVFFASDSIGQGSDELGALLMKGFIYALAEGENKPVRMIFMNSGVNLTVEGSIHLENLRRLQDEGVEILSCGTCLDFYGLKDKLAVGRVSNMYEIVSLLSSGRVLRP
ncbi:MAG TPA: sulfurtransferase-like selenium metabolism protein YedF [Spirochaetales bacterium]|nr:sulfurtransferase-like selenium metabolism protein YedF [Spirochaetales bacterium]